MTCDRDDLSKVSKFIREAHSMQMAVLPPDVNESGMEFTPVTNGIRFALTGIKGVGSSVIEHIIDERKNGRFQSLFDFIQRVDKTKVGKKQIELFIDAGCFDFTEWSRDAMREGIEAMYEEAVHEQRRSERGVMTLFSLEDATHFQTPPPVLTPTPQAQLYRREKELLGFYLTGHPMDSFRKQLSALSCVPFREFENLPDGSFVRAAFIVETVAIKISGKTQRKFAVLTISDGIERYVFNCRFGLICTMKKGTFFWKISFCTESCKLNDPMARFAYRQDTLKTSQRSTLSKQMSARCFMIVLKPPPTHQKKRNH